MLRIVLVLATCAIAQPTDSIRTANADSSARAFEKTSLVRIAEIEAEVRRLAANQAEIDRKAIWKAGDQMEYAIILQVLSIVVSASLSGIGYFNDDETLIATGPYAGFVLAAIGTVKMYSAGTELKRASRAK